MVSKDACQLLHGTGALRALVGAATDNWTCEQHVRKEDLSSWSQAAAHSLGAVSTHRAPGLVGWGPKKRADRSCRRQQGRTLGQCALYLDARLARPSLPRLGATASLLTGIAALRAARSIGCEDRDWKWLSRAEWRCRGGSVRVDKRGVTVLADRAPAKPTRSSPCPKWPSHALRNGLYGRPSRSPWPHAPQGLAQAGQRGTLPRTLTPRLVAGLSSAHSVRSSLSHTPLNVPRWARGPLKWKRASGNCLRNLWWPAAG